MDGWLILAGSSFWNSIRGSKDDIVIKLIGLSSSTGFKPSPGDCAEAELD